MYAQSVENDSAKIMQNYGSAIVRLHVVSSSLTLNGKEQSESFGSGVFISDDGYIITNHHVAGEAVRIYCTLIDKTIVEATLIGTDPLTDIAVIKLVKNEKAPKKYPFLKFGDSNDVKVGDVVFALGSPLAFSQSITMGIVSNTSLVLPDYYSEQLAEDGEGIGDIVSWIAHDALILPGNSGGPLVNSDGEIIGINELLVGLSCSIPSNVANKIANDIIEYGEVIRSDFGFVLQEVLPGMANGVLVADVTKESNAESAGLKSGDIIVSIDDQNVNIQFTEELPKLNYDLMHMQIGKTIKIDVLRGENERFTLNIENIKKKKNDNKKYLNELLGVLFTEDSENGLMVESTKASSPLNKILNLKEFAVIKKINDVKIGNYDELEEYISGLDLSKPQQIFITFSSASKPESKRIHMVTIDANKEVVNIGALASERRPWIPIKTGNMSKDVMKYMGLDYNGGIEVIEVYSGNNINVTPLQIGDIIIKQNNRDIIERYTKGEVDFSDIYRRSSIGDKFNFTALRDNEEVEIEIVLDRYPVNQANVYTNNDFGFTTRDINIFDKAIATEELNGVYVTNVKQGSWASLSELKLGDIIIDFMGQSVTSIIELEKYLEKMKAENELNVIVKVYREKKYHYLSLIIKWDE